MVDIYNSEAEVKPEEEIKYECNVIHFNFKTEGNA